MSAQLSEFEQYCMKELEAGVNTAASPNAAGSSKRAPSTLKFRRREAEDSGIEVREEQMTAVSAQRMYQLRCECGRSWFELVVPKIVNCPACHKIGLVSP
jgi:hypothetical protein